MKATLASSLLIALFMGSSSLIASRDTTEAQAILCAQGSQGGGECAVATTQGTDWINTYLSSSGVVDQWGQWEMQAMNSQIETMHSRK